MQLRALLKIYLPKSTPMLHFLDVYNVDCTGILRAKFFPLRLYSESGLNGCL